MSYRPFGVPYCTHCANINRGLDISNQLPTDHYLRKTRDPDSPITCPELLKTKCPECGVKGHTKFYCLNKMASWRNRVQEISPTKKSDVSVVVNKNNIFDNLSDEDEDDSVYDSNGMFRPRSPDYPPPDW
jgi:hypothetical protein